MREREREGGGGGVIEPSRMEVANIGEVGWFLNMGEEMEGGGGGEGRGGERKV